jgi:hypothetical protein
MEFLFEEYKKSKKVESDFKKYQEQTLRKNEGMLLNSNILGTTAGKMF